MKRNLQKRPYSFSNLRAGSIVADCILTLKQHAETQTIIDKLEDSLDDACSLLKRGTRTKMTTAVSEVRMLFPQNEVLGLTREECQDKEGDTGGMEIAVPLQLQQEIALAVDDGVLQHSATHCNRLQHSATHCNTLVSEKHAHHQFAVTRVGVSPSAAHTPRFLEVLTQEACCAVPCGTC